MNNASAADAPTQRFAEAVRDFAGVPPKRFAALLPLREGIAELRLKGASFGMIRELLATAGIEVCTDTVRRFHRSVIEQQDAATKKPPKRQRSGVQQQPSVAASATPPPPGSAAPVTPLPPMNAAPAAEPTRTRGPRIADPHNL